MKRRKSGEGSEGGFTLIELLIVIVVLGILAAIVVFSLTGVSGESKTAACTTDAKSVETAVTAYEAQNGTTPYPTMADLTTADANGVTYLKAAPGTSEGYAITIDATTGNVQVAPSPNPNNVAATDFSDAAGCVAGQINS
jgi:general secretion pathway protein G